MKSNIRLGNPEEIKQRLDDLIQQLTPRTQHQTKLDIRAINNAAVNNSNSKSYNAERLSQIEQQQLSIELLKQKIREKSAETERLRSAAMKRRNTASFGQVSPRQGGTLVQERYSMQERDQMNNMNLRGSLNSTSPLVSSRKAGGCQRGSSSSPNSSNFYCVDIKNGIQYCNNKYLLSRSSQNEYEQVPQHSGMQQIQQFERQYQKQALNQEQYSQKSGRIEVSVQCDLETESLLQQNRALEEKNVKLQELLQLTEIQHAQALQAQQAKELKLQKKCDFLFQTLEKKDEELKEILSVQQKMIEAVYIEKNQLLIAQLEESKRIIQQQQSILENYIERYKQDKIQEYQEQHQYNQSFIPEYQQITSQNTPNNQQLQQCEGNQQSTSFTYDQPSSQQNSQSQQQQNDINCNRLEGSRLVYQELDYQQHSKISPKPLDSLEQVCSEDQVRKTLKQVKNIEKFLEAQEIKTLKEKNTNRMSYSAQKAIGETTNGYYFD